MIRAYCETVTYHAIMQDVEINGEICSCVVKRILETTPEEEKAILEATKISENNDNLYIGNYEWEIWS